MTDKTRFIVVHTLIAIAVALATFALSFVASVYLLAELFDRLYPHDGQNVLGALFFAFPIAGIVTIIACVISVLLSVRRSLKKADLLSVITEG